MRKSNKVFNIFYKENILHEERTFNNTYLKRLYFKIPELPPTILGEKSIVKDICKYIPILSEELDHHFKTIGNLFEDFNTYAEDFLKRKKEKKSKLWAADFLISDEEFVQALYNRISIPCDMCEHFNVTDEKEAKLCQLTKMKTRHLLLFLLLC